MMLDVKQLTLVYPDRTQALSELSFKLAAGESLALIGANGAGKTSLLLSLVGVLPFSGEIKVDGLELEKAHLREIRSRVGLVFQNPDDQLFMPTIFEDLAFGLRNQGVEESQVRERVERCLNELGLGALRDKPAQRLSGGEKRMAALATVLVMAPLVLLFDEPTAFLDLRARRRLIGVLQTLPCTKLIATHDLAFAEELCGRALLLKAGRRFAEGAPSALFYDRALMEAGGVEALRAGAKAPCGL